MSLVARAQYFQQKESFFHCMDPRAKMAVALIYSIACPLIDHIWILAALTLLSIVFMIVARLITMLWVTLAFALIPFAIYVPVEAWLWNKEPDYITYIKLYFTVTPIMYCGMILGFTTSLDRMMGAFEKLRMPKPVRYGIMVALRYLVMLESECSLLLQGLKVRGFKITFADFFMRPMKPLKLLVLPMLIRSFKVADQMAAAAELKGVSAPLTPKKVQPIFFKPSDFGFVSFNLAIMMAAWVVI